MRFPDQVGRAPIEHCTWIKFSWLRIWKNALLHAQQNALLCFLIVSANMFRQAIHLLCWNCGRTTYLTSFPVRFSICLHMYRTIRKEYTFTLRTPVFGAIDLIARKPWYKQRRFLCAFADFNNCQTVCSFLSTGSRWRQDEKILLHDAHWRVAP